MLSLARRIGAWIAFMLFAPVVAWSEESPPPVVLPRFDVIESAMKIKVDISYRRLKLGAAFVTRVTVAEVKSPSFAEEAGLKSGTEIIAIQGQRLAGLSQAELEKLLAQPAKDSVLLLVGRSWWRAPGEMRILVRPP